MEMRYTEIADAMVRGEIDRQDSMWGDVDRRRDIDNRELMHAAMAQIAALNLRQEGDPRAFVDVPLSYPEGWSGFRDYGSDIANLVVAAAFLHQEIKRKLRHGEDTTRSERDEVYINPKPVAINPRWPAFKKD